MTNGPRSPWERLAPLTASGHVNVVVETPRGSQNKYKYDEGLGLFRLNRILFAGAAFPFDFGFVPGTRGGDGDPLDAIVLTDRPTFPGCLVRVRPLGVLLAKKEGRDNHRIITVPVLAKPVATWRDIADVPVGRLGELEQFFRAVLNVDGYEHALHGFAGRPRADEILARAIEREKRLTGGPKGPRRETPKKAGRTRAK